MYHVLSSTYSRNDMLIRSSRAKVKWTTTILLHIKALLKGRTIKTILDYIAASLAVQSGRSNVSLPWGFNLGRSERDVHPKKDFASAWLPECGRQEWKNVEKSKTCKSTGINLLGYWKCFDVFCILDTKRKLNLVMKGKASEETNSRFLWLVSW